MKPKRLRPGKKLQVNWLTEAEMAEFHAYAKARGVSMTELVREKIREFREKKSNLPR